MKKYSNKECHYCNVILPSNTMIKKTISVHTGYSIPTINLYSKSVRTRRNYYRNKTIWLCEDCKKEGKDNTTFLGVMKRILQSIL